ncbi:MAG: HIRAN domain-containing protein [Lachnospiraceae bacterium]|nr:HIRAN domain-containing protein [Lachnospiraceae bacterium]
MAERKEGKTNPEKNKAQETAKQELMHVSREELSTVLYSPMGLSFEKAFSRQIYLEEVYVAGCGHIKRIKTYVKALKAGDRLQLIREPENAYDELAILIKDEKGHKLGYVPRRNNAPYARLLDAGKVLYAIIDDINWLPDDEDEDEEMVFAPWQLLKIAIYMED